METFVWVVSVILALDVAGKTHVLYTRDVTRSIGMVAFD